MGRAADSPADDRTDHTHLQIQPTETELSAAAVEQGFRRLHGLETESNGWTDRLRGPTPPTLEFRLHRPAGADAALSLYAGITDAPTATLRAGLRAACPNEYELTPATPPSIPTTESTESAPDSEESTASVDEEPLRAVEWVGDADRRDDWQTRLTPFETFTDDDSRLPLAAVVETLAETDAAVTYQVVCQPFRDYRGDVRYRKRQLEAGRDTPASRFVTDLIGPITDPDETATTSGDGDSDRLTALDAVDPRHAFVVNARCLIRGRDATAVAEQLAGTLGATSGPYYRVDATQADDPTRVAAAIRDRTVHQPAYDTLTTKLPWTANRSRGIVADAASAPGFALVDGATLTAAGSRAVAPTDPDRTVVEPPPVSQLKRYHTAGLTLGHPRDQDGTAANDPVAVPPALQSLHVAWFGKTGSGKSTSLLTGMLDNHAATDGAEVLITPKGGDMAAAYLRAHYARYDTLEDVYYFDCTETLPALSVFDIRPQLAAGIDRATAVANLTDHYIEILEGVMGPEQFHQAVRSPDIIRQLVKALFDPVHGSDAFPHRDLQRAAARFHETGEPPAVTDDELQAMLYNVAANSQQTFDELLQGVHNRIEKIPLDDRLGQLFNHVPGDGDPHLDCREVIDEDAVVIIDTGGLRDASQQALTRTVLSKLWTALQRRAQTTAADARPLVNLYLEEAAQLVTSGIIDDLLAQSRSFGCSVTLATQFPGQLRVRDEAAYVELLNNVSTIVTGSVPVDDALTKRLATADQEPAAVANRLRALSRGEWLVRLPAPFNEPPPPPFLAESAPLPPGHPDRDEFRPARETAVAARIDQCRDQTRLTAGLDIRTPQPTTGDDADEATAPAEAAAARVDSALPYTTRLPDPVGYDDERHALQCLRCDSRYDPSPEGLRAAVACCHDPSEVDRDDYPICELSLKLTYTERQESPIRDAGLRFLQAVYSAHQGQYDPKIEYDITRDSMRRLQEYVDIDDAELDELREAGLLSRDCRYPHILYTVTPDGRDAIGVRHREGVAHGAGAGDLSESSLHVAMVEAGTALLETEYVADPDSPAVSVEQYYEVPEGRLDAAAVDETGAVVAGLEAERMNNDLAQAVPDDYDKLAAQEPAAAIWVVKNREAAHEILTALNTPPDGQPRVEKTYGAKTAPVSFTIAQPGLTAVKTFQSVRDAYDSRG
ncbi:hypothetical protein C463_17353 [Halorubrum californiense DSM 19288]|uniref:ATP-binding protein n=1 Tax=Halorubrum californiense DSM 19288 TaxID=1227465 RepID=M0DWL5_9EURY|nr:type IV secretory system conjugative DNA transfer family protein [Halorubrum californiense]ELZ39208.1 hypothetical protein C463_17353 [Halorubrum californiense DSM 19288]